MKIFQGIVTIVTLLQVVGAATGQACQTIYELSTSGTWNGIEFAGSNPLTEIQYFDTPLFLTAEDATAAATDNTIFPVGRAGGFFVIATSAGVWNVEIYDEVDSAISFNYGFGWQAPNVITGGRGDFLGATGEVTSEVVSESPFIVKWTACVY